MKQLNINKDTKIYVASPANTATGGPELLHQLVHELNKLGFNAFMYYYRRTLNINPIHEAYVNYNNSYLDPIDDNPNNILIVPETKTELIYQYQNIQKVIWWLSVDNHFGFLNSDKKIKRTIKEWLYFFNIYPKQKIYRFNKNENIIHFVQSEYAKQMLKDRGIDNPFFLGDYLNNLFIQQQTENITTKKENIVIYNPKKGIEFTKAIIQKCENIKFIPIENMTRDEVSKLLSTAKVYIDFGNHPGKDRIPREAAISGCCIITGRDGSAKYYEDVSIEEEFKFDTKLENIPLIIDKIKNCFVDYEINSKKFVGYREKIKDEQVKFLADIKDIFKINS